MASISTVDTAEAPAVLTGRAQAEGYVASVCFKHGPPRKLGLELEWPVNDARAPSAPVGADHLADALGPHAPTTIRPDSPQLPLPAGGLVTVEPGGQVEISTPPATSLPQLIDRTCRDIHTLEALLTDAGLRLEHSGTNPVRRPRRLLRTPRYDAMQRAFDEHGPAGALMMTTTAALQISLDAGTAAQSGTRWRALHEIGPPLLAAFANSPVLAGERVGAVSERTMIWFGTGPTSDTPACPDGVDPARRWAAHAVAAPVVAIRRATGDWRPPPGLTFGDWADGALGSPPTTDDLDYHLTTLFPPVRPRGHLEVRYLDQQPRDGWQLPLAVLAGLLADDDTTGRARELAAPVTGCWQEAAHDGLRHAGLRTAAGALLRLATDRLDGTVAPELLTRLDDLIDRRVRHGRCPADDLIDQLPGGRS